MVKIYSLHQEIDDKLKYQYSAQKYGDTGFLNVFSKELNNLILRGNLITNHAVCYIAMKYPYSDDYKKNSVIIAEKIVQLNKLPTACVFYNHNPDPKFFYDNQEQAKRKAAVAKLGEADVQKFRNYDFISIEDLIMTGATIKAIQETLKGIAKSLSIISILDLRNKDYIEKELNEFFYNKEGLRGLIKLFNLDGYTITTQMIRTFGMLDETDKNFLLKNIPYPNKLLVSYKKYFGKEVEL